MLGQSTNAEGAEEGERVLAHGRWAEDYRMWKVSLGIRESIDLVRMGRGGVRRRVHMGRRGGDLTETASYTSVLNEGLHAWSRSLATGSQEVQGGPTQAVVGDEY